MAVHLPSDLVSDVMLKADPGRRAAAVAKLQSSSVAQPADFSEGVESAGLQNQGFAIRPGLPLSSAPGGVHQKADHAKAYEGFERMVLRSLFETLLPSESSGSFGSGPSAGVWRSMAADQLAGAVTAGGGIGIADMVDATNQHMTGPRRAAQWPYFALDSIVAVRG